MIKLEEKGVSNLSELNSRIESEKAERKEQIERKNELKNDVVEFDIMRSNIEIYQANKPIITELEAVKKQIFGAKKAEKFRTVHQVEIENFKVARAYLKKYDYASGKLPEVYKLVNKIERINVEISVQDDKIVTSSKRVGELTAMRNVLEEYLTKGRKALEKEPELSKNKSHKYEELE